MVFNHIFKRENPQMGGGGGPVSPTPGISTYVYYQNKTF